MTLPTPQPHLQSLAPYIQGDLSSPGTSQTIKLSSNESPLGPSPRTLEAYTHAVSQLNRYPDGSHTDLRHAIGEQHGLNPEKIVCGAGSDELISLLIRAYSGPGDEIVHSAHGFLMYSIYAKGHGVTPLPAPEKNLYTDIDAVLATVTPETRLVFIANPNNPTGTYLPWKEIERLHAGLPENVILVLDAAYAEFVSRNDYKDGHLLVDHSENTVMLRTFSKIYGLGGARVGWCYCPPAIADTLNRLRSPFNIARPSLEAAATAIQDVEFTALAKSHNDYWRPWLSGILQDLGLETTDSVGNFLLLGFSSLGEKSAQKADVFLRSQGIILRRMDSYDLPSWLRLTIGSADENHRVVKAFTEFLKGRT